MYSNKSYNNKYATWHPVYKSTNIILGPTAYATYSNVFQSNNGIYGSPSRGIGISTIPMTYGRYYWEITVLQAGNSTNERFGFFSPNTYNPYGLTAIYQNATLGYTNSATYSLSSVGLRSSTWYTTLYYENNYLSGLGSDGHFIFGSYSIVNGDVFSFAIDVIYGSFSVKRNGTNIGSISTPVYSLTSSTGKWFAACASDGGTTTASTYWANFGQATFSYTPPDGFMKGIMNPIYPKLDPNHINYYNYYTFLYNNNLTARVTKGINSGVVYILGQFGKSIGKWYWEVTVIGGSVSNAAVIGVAYRTVSAFPSYINPDIWCWANNTKFGNGIYAAYGGYYGVGDIIGVGLNMDDGSITMFKNGTNLGVMFTGLTAGLTGSLYPYASNYTSTGGTLDGPAYTFNFGQTPFAYPVPSGYNYGIYE